MKSIVVGGGIGGLAIALGLSRAGHDVVVLERYAFSELGAGIQLAPNGLAALDRLGLGAQIRELGSRVSTLRFMNGTTGRAINTLDLGPDYQRRFRASYLVIHRGELHLTLLKACQAAGNISLQCGWDVQSYRESDDGVSVFSTCGQHASGSVLIGADGINSAVRQQLIGDGGPRSAGITAFRSAVPIEKVPAALRGTDVTCWAGSNRHLVHYEIAGGSLLNIALSVEDGATSPRSNVPTDDAVVRELAASLCSTPRSIVALGRDWRSWTLVDRDPIERWSAGRVVLLGDAAHPSLHYLAQGACQAFEDAVLLADLLRDAATSDVSLHLARYCRLREGRCKRITFGAREMVQYLNAEGDDAIRRDSWMSLLTSTEIYGKLAWLHGRRPKVPR